MPRPARAAKPSLSAQKVPRQWLQEVWYYEDKRGVEVYVRLTSRDDVMVAARIPWGMLMRSARRCGRKLPRAAASDA